MGRPKLHGPETRAELLRKAGDLVTRDGPEALSIRGLAREVGTSTRAVYSLFGNKDGLLDALYRESYLALIETLKALPLTKDPEADLLRAAIDGFRRYAVENPHLFRLAFERVVARANPKLDDLPVRLEARALLRTRVQRCIDAGLFADRPAELVVNEFHAFCQGLASIELRGWLRDESDPALVWRDALSALLTGLNKPKRPIISGRAASGSRTSRRA